MRRALLTAMRAAAGPLSVGNDGTFGATNFNTAVAINTSDPATAGGTVATVKVSVVVSGIATGYIIIGSLSGSTFTVRSVSGAKALPLGAATLTGENLAVVAGDYIGIVITDGGTGRLSFSSTTGETIGWSSSASVPIPGSTFALTNFNDGRLSILGTNP